MNERLFVFNVRRGLGRAIQELKSNPERTKYRDALLRCCLRSIAYDWQCEGTKGHYLYQAIEAIGEKEWFEGKIIEKFLSRVQDPLFLQLGEILTLYAESGSKAAAKALREKYNYFAAKGGKLSTSFREDIIEGFQWDETTKYLFHTDGFTAFTRYAYDVGAVLQREPDNQSVYYDLWYIQQAEEYFGKKRIERFFREKRPASPAIQALWKAMKQERRQWPPKARRQDGPVSLNALYERAVAVQQEEYARARVTGLVTRFAAHATENELQQAATLALEEKNAMVKALLLLMFERKPFPLDCAPLLEYALSECEPLAYTSIRVLSQLKDDRIHAFARRQLSTGPLGTDALPLFQRNYHTSDDALINTQVRKAGAVSHDVQMNIRKIYNENPSHSAFPVLSYVYRKGRCSFCRNSIVEAMEYRGVLTQELLEECLYDSDSDTRALARRLQDERA